MFRLFVFIILVFCLNFANVELYSATKVITENIAPATSRNEGRKRMISLVEKFLNDKNANNLTEAQTRQVYLDEFLRCLGWDAGNYQQHSLYNQDTLPEARLFLSNTTRFIDYKQRIDDKVFMLEAKRVKVDCDKEEYIFQAKRYCWSSMKSDVVILSNFRQFRVYTANNKPLFNSPTQGKIEQFTLNFEDYPKYFDLLYDTFSRESVQQGSIKKMLQTQNSNLNRTLPDKELIKNINSLRLKLATNIYENNSNVTIDELNEATQNILNKILFCRILEDRDIEPTRLLELKVAHYFGDKILNATELNVESLHKFISHEFTTRMYKRYRGIIFKPHFSDKLKISDNLLRDIILNFYPPQSSFEFSILPVDVIGHVYESYLGERIFVENNVVKLEKTPSVRESGGVFYTPDNIAEFLVSRTLNPIVENKNIDELLKLKIIDPASGSGALLLQSAKVLFSKAREFYSKNSESINNKNSEFPSPFFYFYEMRVAEKITVKNCEW